MVVQIYLTKTTQRIFLPCLTVTRNCYYYYYSLSLSLSLYRQDISVGCSLRCVTRSNSQETRIDVYTEVCIPKLIIFLLSPSHADMIQRKNETLFVPRGNNLLERLDEDIGMLLFKDEHGPEADGAGAAAADVDAERLGPLEEVVATGIVEGDEGSHALASQVLELGRVAGGEALELGEEVVADLGGAADEVAVHDLVDDGAEEQGAGGVAHPRVELAVGLVGAQLGVAVVVAGGLGLLGEGDHVRGLGQIPVLVRPEAAGGADARLDLVDDEEHAVLARQGAQAAEAGGRRVVVAALGLAGLDEAGGRRHVEVEDEVLHLGEGVGLGALVGLGVLVQGVLQLRERGVRPVEGGDVELVDGLGPRGCVGVVLVVLEARFVCLVRLLCG